jgi:hypothetical protein
MSDKLREEFESNTGRRLVWNRSAWAEYATIIESALLRERELRVEVWNSREDCRKEFQTANDRIKELESRIEAMKCCGNCEGDKGDCRTVCWNRGKPTLIDWQPKGEKQ